MSATLHSILSTALAEHDFPQNVLPPTIDELHSRISAQLQDEDAILPYSHDSRQMALVSFRCMLQDTGYPTEVYLPGDANSGSPETDWTRLRERVTAWAVEIPGAQDWSSDGQRGLAKEDVTSHILSSRVRDKSPIAEHGDYLGALIKIYDDASLKPATIHHFIGILSASPLPTALAEDENDTMVPSIHVVRIVPSVDPLISETSEDTRDALLTYLSSAFQPPDRLAAIFLLLALLSGPTARPPGMEPLGTLCVNFIRSHPASTAKLATVISSVWSPVVSLNLSISMLHSSTFSPAATESSSLAAGKLQLAPRTVLVVNEDDMGQGGELNEKALHNMKALAVCLSEQVVHYEYPYIDPLRMDCSIKGIIVGEGKSLLPADVTVPLNLDDASSTSVTDPSPDLETFRQYLAAHSSASQTSKFNMPDEVAQMVQDEFVRDRRDAGTAADDWTRAEANLKRRMRIARVLAVSYPGAKLTKAIWAEAVAIDVAVQRRLTQYKASS
ncbi:hypothetical protein BCR39DRAFT_519587 [Naematelia encephala]|uniref:Mini-chromosome maintenance replisome factor-domain-containing protein n=1 Tax=Naematelia encephala TaxID=71784 RepID=A0A1Y2BEW1_9TREE|nr:hypothetical protein BCR39DRAFT_519587 [Naematelia encephala]